MAAQIRKLAIPQDHGTWIFLISPLLIGFFATSSHQPVQLIIVIGSLIGFLMRQPVSLWVKIRSGRKTDANLSQIKQIAFIYGLIGLLCVSILLLNGQGFVLLLAIPGGLTFIWHLYLVSLRKERYQMGVDLVASGTLALAAPAIYWAGIGSPDWTGMLLWLLCWLQSASSIVHIFMRLKQRDWNEILPLSERFSIGKRNILYAGTNSLFVLVLGITNIVPFLIVIPFILQFLECIYGIYKPATGMKPTVIGLRQLAVSSLFTILFIIIW